MKARGKAKFVLLPLAALGFVAVGYLAEHAPLFAEGRAAIQRSEVPTTLLQTGKLGEGLRQTGVLIARPNPGDFYARATDAEEDVRTALFRNKGRKSDVLLEVHRGGDDTWPSTVILSPSQRAAPGLALSIVTGDGNAVPAYHPIGARTRRPDEWIAYATLLRDGKILEATSVGIRSLATEVGAPPEGYQLALRPKYGAESTPGPLLFGPGASPVRRFHVRDVNWYHANPLGLEIASILGVPAPRTHPLTLSVNGHSEGLRHAIEDINDEWIVAHYGLADWLLVDTTDRSVGSENLPPEYLELEKWLTDESRPLSLEELATRIDLDNYTRWVVASIICLPQRPFEGVAVLNRADPAARWFWVADDMRGAFVPGTLEQFRSPDSIAFIANQGELRSRLLRRLLAEQPAFRESLVRRLLLALNLELTQPTLDSMAEEEESVLRTYGALHPQFARNRAFLRDRVERLLAEIAVFQSESELVRVSIQSLEPGAISIEGHVLAEQEAHWRWSAKIPLRFSATGNGQWLVNGQPQGQEGLELRVSTDTLIERIH